MPVTPPHPHPCHQQVGASWKPSLSFAVTRLFPRKVHTVFLRDQNDSQCHQCHLDTTSQDIFCYVTNPVGETEVAGDSPFLSASRSKMPGGSSAIPAAWHPSQISRRFQACLLCIRYPVDNKTNSDVSRQSTETPEVQSVCLLCSDQSFWKHLLSGGQGGEETSERNETERHSAVKLSSAGFP